MGYTMIWDECSFRTSSWGEVILFMQIKSQSGPNPADLGSGTAWFSEATPANPYPTAWRTYAPLMVGMTS